MVASIHAQMAALPLQPVRRHMGPPTIPPQLQAIAPAAQPPPPPALPQPPLQHMAPAIPRAQCPIIEAQEPSHNLGPMTVKCPSCGALHWMDERLSSSSKRNPKFGKCCLSGKIQLPELMPPPQPLKRLLESSDTDANEFRKHIRQYNAALAFTSLGAKFNQALFQGGGPYALCLIGELYHQLGALLPNENRSPSYAQLYLYDPAEARQFQLTRNNHLDANTMSDLQDMMLEHNPFVGIFRQAQEILREQSEDNHLHVRLTYKAHTDPRHYNLPTSDEIAVILPGDGTPEGDKRDIILRRKGGGLKRISECHPTYSPLHYVLLFPKGELGWHWDIPLREGHGRAANADDPDESNRTVSQINYYAYCLFPREGEYSTILLGGKLLQEYIVDSWARHPLTP